MTRAFADRLIEKTREFGPLCVGIDPHPGLFPELFGKPSAGAIAVWADGIIEAAAGQVACIKPQAAFFELWGSVGMAALEHVCKTARDADLLVILDAKRGDIGSTAKGYADAYLGETAACPCDALTVNPFMGYETLQPFIDAADPNGRGIAVLTRTSNPGAADIQELDFGGEPIFLRLAREFNKLGKPLKGDETDWSGFMFVAGATAPDEARKIRSAAPDNLFLVPGYGAQGAGADQAVSGFIPIKGTLEGGVVNASRSVTFPEAAQNAGSTEEWQTAIRDAIAFAQDDLRKATRRNVD
ncbi:MAG: orotidine-5'-phosphate decarboxylase [Ponticaulis sp.]|nr:orotidine-5'-phosphate decarboxylase [Ponticaulis sp.]|tara:strand:- start:17552 stop:18448 length:897 start_codon:yes stop_codon:yes gene_type:complete